MRRIKGEERMRNSKRKNSAIVVSLFLLFAMTVSLVALPSVNAQGYKEKNTYAMCGLTPNPVGVGQEVLVWVGISDMLWVYTDMVGKA